MRKNKTLILGIIMVLITVFSFTFTEGNATIIPIINAKTDTGKFSPSTLNVSSVLNDYYIIPTGTNLPSQIIYHSNVTGSSNSGAYYIPGSSNGDTYGSYSGPSILNDGSTVNTNFRTNNTRNTLYTNPFLPTNDHMPSLVKLTNQNGQNFQTAPQVEPFSLHKDYSFSFFADPTYTYTGIINTTQVFFLDIAIQNTGASVTLSFGSGPNGPNIIAISVPKMTIPIFPVNGTDLQYITLSTSQSTVITLTPHSVPSNTLRVESIPVNSSYIEDFVQGSESTQGGNTISISTNTVFSVREFNFSITSGQYYQIYFNFQNYNTCPTCSTYLSAAYQFLLGNDYLPISGSLTTNGLTIYAETSTNLTLIFVAQGYQDGSLTTYLRNISSPSQVNLIPLQFGQNLKLLSSNYYTFTLTQPAVIAVNYTSTADNTRVRNMVWYMAGNPQQPWISITSTSNLYTYGLSGGTIGSGNLYGATVGGMRTTWAYLPAGNYAVALRPTDGSMTSTVEFTMAYVQTLSSTTTLNINQNSLYAIDLSNLVHNQINFLNLSTTDHINQTIQYQYVIMGKYFDYEKLTPSEGYPSLTLGNKQQSGQWLAFNSNNSNIQYYIPTTVNFDPILIIRPFMAQFLNLSQEHSFTATLTVTSNTPTKFYNTNIAFSFPTASARFISESTSVLATSVLASGSFAINSDLTTATTLLFAIPLTTNPNILYNMTVYLIGNYSTTGSLNATFTGSPNSVYAYGGNLRDLNVNFGASFGARVAGSNNIERWINQWILTVSNNSYLYVNIGRTTSGGKPRNATLMITLQQLPVATMSFGLTPLSAFSWNQTVSAQEVKNTGSLLTFTLPSSFGSSNVGGGSFDIGTLLLIGGVGVVGAAAVAAIVLKRDKLKDVIKNIKRP